MAKLSRAAFLGAVLGLTLAGPGQAADLIGFWDSQQKGANSFNELTPGADYFQALAATGATWVRLTFSKWQGEGRDFLLGNADKYQGLPEEDVEKLRRALNAADAAGLKVVIAPLSLPGARWSQQNDGTFDDRLWSDPSFADQAVRFWSDMAKEFKDHPAIAAYNIVNEPAPEKTTGLAENGAMGDLIAWQKEHQGGLRDLPAFYNRVIAAIREQDALTPVMVDGGFYANPRSLAAWPDRLPDDRVLYAFHMYEPYEATSSGNTKRDEPFRYPGVTTLYAGEELSWSREDVAAHIGKAFDWAEEQGLAASRVVASEFGCMRRWLDCGSYLKDVIDAVDARGGHWAFYAFREEWEGMDYELPLSLKPGRFYWMMEEGKSTDIPRNGRLMDILKEELNG
ncbi:glycoside hydrolase family 5 protein [Roseibium sediminicola]|uniref:Glycoside hydrolase family 5 protein n=1 Tax=Roseibium sediminicola TaxID=2933272 RepID=A0ABT0GY69_9HYPH|nr:cellulase family glycosylhydrolase [Roseibium sp. CAU 1639]MCK7614190.1 glycoside hydrolase family 5 protein [Roseibium sp. CAU 1639]